MQVSIQLVHTIHAAAPPLPHHPTKLPWRPRQWALTLRLVGKEGYFCVSLAGKYLASEMMMSTCVHLDTHAHTHTHTHARARGSAPWPRKCPFGTIAGDCAEAWTPIGGSEDLSLYSIILYKAMDLEHIANHQRWHQIFCRSSFVDQLFCYYSWILDSQPSKAISITSPERVSWMFLGKARRSWLRWIRSACNWQVFFGMAKGLEWLRTFISFSTSKYFWIVCWLLEKQIQKIHFVSFNSSETSRMSLRWVVWWMKAPVFLGLRRSFLDGKGWKLILLQPI